MGVECMCLSVCFWFVKGRFFASYLLLLEHRAEGLRGGRPGALGLAEAEFAERGADVGDERAAERVCKQTAIKHSFSR